MSVKPGDVTLLSYVREETESFYLLLRGRLYKEKLYILAIQIVVIAFRVVLVGLWINGVKRDLHIIVRLALDIKF